MGIVWVPIAINCRQHRRAHIHMTHRQQFFTRVYLQLLSEGGILEKGVFKILIAGLSVLLETFRVSTVQVVLFCSRFKDTLYNPQMTVFPQDASEAAVEGELFYRNV